MLLKNGYKIIIIDNLSSGYKKLLNKKAKFIKGDINDKSKINYILSKKIILPQ